MTTKILFAKGAAATKIQFQRIVNDDSEILQL